MAEEHHAQGVPAPEADYVALCGQYLPLVRHAVSSYAYRLPGYVDVDELTGAALLGLVEAARRFDPGRGVPFEPWALQRVRGAILDAARAADHASRKTRQESRRMESTTDSLIAMLGRVPTEQELSQELGVSLAELADLRARVHRGLVLSLDEPAGEEEGTGFAEMLVDADLPPLETLERRELDAYVRDCVAVLPERHREVISAYFFEGTTSSDIANKLGVTESRVSQMRSEAIKLLRSALGTQYEEIRSRTSLPRAQEARGQDLARQAEARSTYAQRIEERKEVFL